MTSVKLGKKRLERGLKKQGSWVKYKWITACTTINFSGRKKNTYLTRSYSRMTLMLQVRMTLWLYLLQMAFEIFQGCNYPWNSVVYLSWKGKRVCVSLTGFALEVDTEIAENYIKAWKELTNLLSYNSLDWIWDVWNGGSLKFKGWYTPHTGKNPTGLFTFKVIWNKKNHKKWRKNKV